MYYHVTNGVESKSAFGKAPGPQEEGRVTAGPVCGSTVVLV